MKEFIELQKVKLSSTKYSKVYREKETSFNAPHNFTIHNNLTGDLLTTIHFQEGPIKEAGVNGVFGEDLIAIVLERLHCFQDSEYACKENDMAITKLEEALLWLRKRTLEREDRGVEGTHKI